MGRRGGSDDRAVDVQGGQTLAGNHAPYRGDILPLLDAEYKKGVLAGLMGGFATAAVVGLIYAIYLLVRVCLA